MSELDALLAGIVSDPREETRWLVLADWLQEHDDPRRAELLRLHRQLIATCLEPDSHPARGAWQARVVELLVAGVRPCVPQQTLTLPGGVPMTFSFIPPGAFVMGSDHPEGEKDERPVHRVEIARGFFLGIFPVTQAQWAAVMGTDPSEFKGPNRPVECVSWHDCQEFCGKLSELIGRRVALPTEAEWEYACRAGTTTEYFFGDTLYPPLAGFTDCLSWSVLGEDFYPEKTADVGSLPPNVWGLHDVHGNVWEWCEAEFLSYPTTAPNRQRVIPDIPYGVLRGGCLYSGLSDCRAASRFAALPNSVDYDGQGFRVCFHPD